MSGLAVSRALLEAINAANNVLILVTYGDDLTSDFGQLKAVDAIKIILVNKNVLEQLPKLMSHVDAFDSCLFYDGPTEDLYGNPEIPDDDTEILVPCVYEAVTSLMEQILPVVRSRSTNSIYLNTISEELLLQMSILRKKYGLTLGPPPSFAKLFVSKVLMKDFFRRNEVHHPQYALIHAQDLRKYSDDQLKIFVQEKLPNFPVFVKPSAGSGCYESCEIANYTAFRDWLRRSENFDFQTFLVDEILSKEEYYLGCVTEADMGIRSMICAESPPGITWGGMAQNGTPMIVKFLTEGPLYREIETFGKGVLEKAGSLKYPGVYFLDLMRKNTGEIAVLEMAARCYAGLATNLAISSVTGYDPECYAIAAPFMQGMQLQDPSAIKYKHFCNVFLPSWKDGRVKKYNDIDGSLVKLGAEIVSVEKTFSPGDLVRSKDLESIYYMASTISIAGNDEIAVDATAEALCKFHDPVEVA